jgi:hypothetical protein
VIGSSGYSHSNDNAIMKSNEQFGISIQQYDKWTGNNVTGKRNENKSETYGSIEI